MPNYVRNIIKMEGITTLPLFTEVKKFDGSTSLSFDFNKLIPMPESLNMDEDSSRILAVETVLRDPEYKDKDYNTPLKMSDAAYERCLQSFGKSKEKLYKLGLQYINNFKLYGAYTWYNWRIDNWGTKWNAIDYEKIDNDTIVFSTAWVTPLPILEKLANLYPNNNIEFWWADEDIGTNTGYGEYLGSNSSIISFNDYSNEAYETYVHCWGGSRCLEKDENGIWKRKNCDLCHGCD